MIKDKVYRVISAGFTSVNVGLVRCASSESYENNYACELLDKELSFHPLLGGSF